MMQKKKTKIGLFADRNRKENTTGRRFGSQGGDGRPKRDNKGGNSRGESYKNKEEDEHPGRWRNK